MTSNTISKVVLTGHGVSTMRVIRAIKELELASEYRFQTLAVIAPEERETALEREADEVCVLEGGQRSADLEHVFDQLDRMEGLGAGDILVPPTAPGAPVLRWAELAESRGARILGPSADRLRSLLDPLRLRRLAEEAGVATVPWSGAIVRSLQSATEQAERLGYPVVLRSSSAVQIGLGVARNAAELPSVFRRAEETAEEAEASVVLERLMPGTRRLEVSVLSFSDGTRWVLDVIDASLRRRDGSVMLEAPASGLSETVQNNLRSTALTLAEAFQHEHLGTFAFLFDPSSQSITFHGFDLARGGEYAAAEKLRGLDLAKLRVQMTMGLASPHRALPQPRGVVFAAHLRVHSESAEAMVLEHLVPSSGPGTRTDVASVAGDRLVDGASVAEIVASGSTRNEALARLERALAESAFMVQGGRTSVDALAQILTEPEPRAGAVLVDWLVDKLGSEGFRARTRAPLAVLATAIEAYELGHASDREEFHQLAERGRRDTRPAAPRAVELEHDGHLYPLEVAAISPRRYLITTDAGEVQVDVEHQRGRSRTLSLVSGGRSARHRVTSSLRGRVHELVVDGEPHRVLRETRGVVKTAFPALVSSVFVEEGQSVSAGDRIVTLEAMKMELGVETPFEGRVRKVLVQRSQQVAAAEALVWIESDLERLDRDPMVSPRKIDFSPMVVDALPFGEEPLTVLEALFLGYDVTPGQARAATKAYLGLGMDPVRHEREVGLLNAFVYLLELSPSSLETEDAPDRGLQLSYGEYFRDYLLGGERAAGLPTGFTKRLRHVASLYGLEAPKEQLLPLEAIYRLHMAMARRSEIVRAVLELLGHRAEDSSESTATGEFRAILDRLIAQTQSTLPELCETARAARFQMFDRPYLEEVRSERTAEIEAASKALESGWNAEAIATLTTCPFSVTPLLLRPDRSAAIECRSGYLEALTRRYYGSRHFEEWSLEVFDRRYPVARARYRDQDGNPQVVLTTIGPLEALQASGHALQAKLKEDESVVVSLFTWRQESELPTIEELQRVLAGLELPPSAHQVSFVCGPGEQLRNARGTAPCVTFDRVGEQLVENHRLGDLHPMIADRLELARYSNFDLQRAHTVEDVYAFRAVGKGQPEDKRIIVFAEVRDLGALRDQGRRWLAMPQLERVVAESLSALRKIRSAQLPSERTDHNRLELLLRPVADELRRALARTIKKLAPATVGLGLDEVRAKVRFTDGSQELVRLNNPSGLGVEVHVEPPSTRPVPRLSRYEQKVAKLRRRGLMHPRELMRLLTPSQDEAGFPRGERIELDLDEKGALVPVSRGPGENESNIIVARLTNYDERYPEGMTRIALFGDPSRAMGSIAEPECRRVIAALDLAEQSKIPAEWYAVSAGAEISKDRGTENMDWVSAVLKRIIEYTQAGQELNVVVCGINVGAQPYWNAEATMLMHTKGVLVMTPASAMVLTGKQALDFSGGVSAEDNQGIGGYDRVMGPNGQAQYFAPDLLSAAKVLLRHYAHSYRAANERFPRPASTTDARDRDVRTSPHFDSRSTDLGPREQRGEKEQGQALGVMPAAFETVGEVFSDRTNPDRKFPFDIRSVMRAVSDADHVPLERWRDARDAETVVVWHAHLGGYPVALLGVESRPIRRLGFVPGDGPKMWTSGTLFPQSSWKMARAINAASGSLPLVILANLSGFDGSPESLRQRQLEMGAEIGRAIVNFDGPIVFTVVSRFHGGAFVVFSNQLNPRMETFALEGTYASVIGGAPAAAVVFARALKKRVSDDPRVVALEQAMQTASGAEAAETSVRLREARAAAYADHLGALAGEYDGIHSIERAQKVGSVHHIIPPERLRPELIAAVERGMAN